jgi:hypothetical protein
MLVITKFHLIFPDWRGYLVSGFSLVWVANFYMSLFRRLRLDIKKQKTDVELKEEMLDEKKGNSNNNNEEESNGHSDADNFRPKEDFKQSRSYL